MIIEDLRLQTFSHFIDFKLEDDRELNEIVELASAVTNAPYVVISFLDDETAHLIVRKGVIETSVPRKLSFCNYAVDQDDLMMVHDTLNDPRFAENPFVIDGPRLRFFAAMPLISQDGKKIGTICVLDIEPRVLDCHQQLVLKMLSHQVMKIVELRAGMALLVKKQAELEAQKKLTNNANIRLRSFFESSTNFQVLLGKHGEIIDYNKTAYNFIKTVHHAKITRGDQLVKYLAPDFVATFLKFYDKALNGQKAFVEGSTKYDELGVVWWEAAFEAARDDENRIIGISYLIRNVTERKLKEQKIIAQNTSLKQIAHIQAHEFRAPLASIMGLMNLIKDEGYNAPQEYLELLDQAVNNLDCTIRQIVGNIDNSVIPEYALDNQ